MNKKILSFVLFLLIVVFPVVALAEEGGQPVSPIVLKIKIMFISIGGMIVVIGWIIAGILYLTAAGNPEKIGIAKKALFAAVIGTALIVLATSVENILKFYLQ